MCWVGERGGGSGERVFCFSFLSCRKGVIYLLYYYIHDQTNMHRSKPTQARDQSSGEGRKEQDLEGCV